MNNFRNENTNAALDFAYAMGLKRPEATDNTETNSALDFAYAMGLKRYLKDEPAKRSYTTGAIVPAQLRFI